jgi:hypothetical protein
MGGDKTNKQVDIPELLKGVGASNVRVQDKEGSVVLAENLASERKRTSCILSAPRLPFVPLRLSSERLFLPASTSPPM